MLSAADPDQTPVQPVPVVQTMSEHVAVALIGLPFGLVGGVLLADRLLSTYHSLGYPLRLEMHATTPMVVALAMLGAAAMAQLPMVQRIHRLDLARIVRERAL